MKDEPEHLLHKDNQALPPVIHTHDDETILARWLRRGVEKGASFWLLLAGSVAALAAVFYLLNAAASRTSPEASAWLQVIVPSAAGSVTSAKYEGQPTAIRPLLATADEHPGSPAADWALYQAGAYLYQEGLRELPANRDAGKPSLTQAAELFERVLKDSKADSPVRKLAQLGLARTLETRGELAEARDAYLKVASTYPDTPEATAAQRRAEQLNDPAVKQFYQDFGTEDFATFTPGAGLGAGRPGLGSGLPLGAPGLSAPMGSSLYPPAIPEGFQGAPTQPAAGSELPKAPFAGSPDAPKVEAPKADAPPLEAPPAAPADAPKPETSKVGTPAAPPDAPKAETPKVEAPAAPVEAPKPAEAPKADAPAPAPGR